MSDMYDSDEFSHEAEPTKGEVMVGDRVANDLVLRERTEQATDLLAPVGTINDLLDRYNLQAEFIKSVLKEKVDYGVIPGTQKKTLLKAGAEKITTLFGLSSKFPKEMQERVEDWTGENHGGEPFFFYEDTCQLYKDGVLIAEASGSCNSWEKKYRYRTAELKCPTCGKEGTVIKGKEEYGGGWLCWAKKNGCGAKFSDGDPMIEDQPRDTIPNPFIFDQVNTIKKMCQKRAYVAAVLMAGNVSDYFTQDVEDSDEVGPNIDTGSAPKAEPKAEVKIENPGQIEVGFPKALKLFGGKAPTVEQLFAEDPDYCNWIYQNGKGDWAKAVRAFMDTQQVVQREAQQEGKQPSGVDIVDAVEDAETILAQTEGDLTPTHYWGMVRKMGIDEASAADIANQGGGDWRKALQLAVNAKRGIK